MQPGPIVRTWLDFQTNNLFLPKQWQSTCPNFGYNSTSKSKLILSASILQDGIFIFVFFCFRNRSSCTFWGLLTYVPLQGELRMGLSHTGQWSITVDRTGTTEFNNFSFKCFFLRFFFVSQRFCFSLVNQQISQRKTKAGSDYFCALINFASDSDVRCFF